MTSHHSLVSLIGNTPLVKISNIDTGCCELYVKLENQNPSGSIKDRIALTMIDAAEKSGALKPGGTIVDATAGNTGLGLLLVGLLKGYKVLLVIPDKMSREKIQHLRSMGATIVMTRSDVGKGHPQYYQDMAERLAKEILGGCYINQFKNDSNPQTHEMITGPEIWEQMDHNLDAVVVGVGTGGTLTGLGRYFAKVAPHLEMVLADPEGSILNYYVQTHEILSHSGSWLVEGIGEDYIPPKCDLSLVKKSYSIRDEESFFTCRELLKKEGILAGSSAGTLVSAALTYCREQTIPKRVVTFICDSGNKYLSKMFNDSWMREHGFLERPTKGDLSDLVARRHEEGETITVSPHDNLSTAYAQMKLHDISQLPVLENEKVVGILDEEDILFSLQKGRCGFSSLVQECMTTHLVVFSLKDSFEDLTTVLKKGMVAIIEDAGAFIGLITKSDLLGYLRKKGNI